MPQEIREVLLKYGKNPVFYSGDREDTGFLLITSGSAAQSSIIDDFATLPSCFYAKKGAIAPVDLIGQTVRQLLSI